MKKRYKYIHLISGQPGTYVDGQQVCHAGSTQFPIKPVESLRQLRREQRLSVQWRLECKLSEGTKYGYAKVLV